MGGANRVAYLLGIPVSDAISYCEEVRKLCGYGSRLHYTVIAGFMDKNPTDRSPQHIAEKIKQNYPPEIQLPIQPKKKSRRPFYTGSYSVTPASIGGGYYDLHTEKASKPSGIVHTSYFDQERVSPEKLEHCQHGVPLLRLCAICNPKKFREMTGID